MSKVWVIGSKIYFNEKTALKAANDWESPELKSYWGKPKVKVFTLESEVDASSFIQEHERDTQLRSVLGELTPDEIKKNKIKSGVSNLIEVMTKINFPNRYISEINKTRNTPTVLLKFINDNKVSMLSLSNDVEYYKALIKLTGFRKLSKTKYHQNYDRYTGKYTYEYKEQITGLDEIFYKNFEQAKKELKDGI
jgi:hypothetical protein